MSQQIDEVFSNYRKVFKAKEEEIRDYLLTYYEKAFRNRKIINVERKDSTDRIKTAGFNKDISSWQNYYKNIVVSVCFGDNGAEKRYDYKFLFTKEKLNEATIEIIENAIKESNRLKVKFQFDEAITKIDEMLELIQKKHDEIFNKILTDARLEIVAAKEIYDKTMEQITKLEERIKINRKIDNLKAAVNDCEKIIELTSSINRGDIASKYRDILTKTQNEIETRKAQEAEKSVEEKKALEEKRTKERYDNVLEQIAKLEEGIKISLNNGNLKAIVNNCEEIINISELINRNDIAKKYMGILEDTMKEIETQKALKKDKALEANKARKEEKELKKKQAIEKKNALKEQKAQEKSKALEEKQALKEQKAQEKAKALADKKALDEKKTQEKNAQILEQIAKLEESFNTNQENNILQAIVSDCEKIINLANSINKEDLVEKYTGILEDTRKELEAIKAQENASSIEEKQALMEKKAQEKAKALEEKQALKAQKAQEKAKVLEEQKALDEKKSQERNAQILEEIAKLEEDIKSFQEIGNLPAVVSDCEKVINLANSINKEDLVENYMGILEEARKELEAKKAQENAKTSAEKQALKEKKAQEKVKALAEKQALKEQKAQEKEKRLEDKKAIREEIDTERYGRLLEQISKFEEDIKDYQETKNLTSITIACEKIIRIAKLINRKDIAKKYSTLLKQTKIEMLSQTSITEEKPLKEKKSQEQKDALREEKAIKKKKALEKKKALKDSEAQEKEKALTEKRALREQKEYDFTLKRIPILEEIIKNNLKNDNLKAVIRDCEKIIELANLVNNEDLKEKYSAILASAKEEVETRKANRSDKTLEEKQASKERKLQEKTKALADKKALDEIKAQVKHDQILGHIAELEEDVKIYQENDNTPALVSDCEKIIDLANSINKLDLVEKYTNILEDARKELGAIKAHENAKTLEEKQALKEKKAQEKARAQATKKALKERKAQEKAKIFADKRALDEKKAQERNDQTLKQIAELEESVKINQEIDNVSAIVSECEKIINLANSISKEVLGEKYTVILEDARKQLESRKAQEKAKALEEKQTLKEKKAQEKAKLHEEKSAPTKNVINKPMMILNIIGGLFMIVSGIANIILLFNMIYSNIIPIIGIETADTFFIFLYVNACICIIGGILVIFGSLEVISNYFKPGKSLISFGLTVDLIGSMMLLLVGLWAGTLCGSLAAFIISSIWIYFGISVVAILLAIVSLIKIGEREEEIPKTYYVGIKKDKVIEKKAIRE